MKSATVTVSVPTSEGAFLVQFSGSGLCGIQFPQTRGAVAPEASLNTAQRAWLELTREAILLALSGKAPRRLPPLDVSQGTAFQQEVWREMRRIPLGGTAGYGELAARIGRPGGARAVGMACGANPMPLIIPCHRVLAARGKLGGFSGGLDWKRLLLGREGVTWRE